MQTLHDCCCFRPTLLILAWITTTLGQIPDSSRSFRTSNHLGAESRQLVDDKLTCFQYSWMGPATEKINTTVSCKGFSERKMPCFEPFVWTSGENKGNQPNTTELTILCKTEGNLDGLSCNPFCQRDTDEVCIKMTYRNLDTFRTVVYTSSFCGKGILTTSNNIAITSGCHLQENLNGLDVEACFCTANNCNHCPIWRPFGGAAMAWLAGLWWCLSSLTFRFFGN